MTQQERLDADNLAWEREKKRDEQARFTASREVEMDARLIHGMHGSVFAESRAEWRAKLPLIQEWCDGAEVQICCHTRYGELWVPTDPKMQWHGKAEQYRIKPPQDSAEQTKSAE